MAARPSPDTGSNAASVLLHTRRLDLLPCSVEVARAIARNRDELERLVGAPVPDDWPAWELQEFLPAYARQLQADPSLLGWGVWLMVHRARRTVVGDLGFKGRPDRDGTVEIGYSVLPAYRRQGYASEAARALVDWALAQEGVRRITAECRADNAPSIRILEKLGMQRVEVGGGVLKWELQNEGPGRSLECGY